MFKTDGIQLAKDVQVAEGNYIIRKGDYLEVKVYTNEGERLVDPNFELVNEQSSRSVANQEKPSYLIKENGKAKLPLVGDVALEGLTLYEADSVLAEKYSNKYVSPFVITKLKNRRIVVIGPKGGKVIPLDNENMNLIEVIALYGQVGDKESNMTNIRLIRGDLKDPIVQKIDLGTIEGMQKANMLVQANDIVYIEPIRKVVSESFRDIAPILGVLTNVLTLVIIITR